MNFLTQRYYILVECLFADSCDADKYNADLIAKAIVNGLVDSDSSSNNTWKFGWNRNSVGWWYCTDIVNKYYYTSKNGLRLIDGEWYILDDKGYALQNTWYYLYESCKIVRWSKEKP